MTSPEANTQGPAGHMFKLVTLNTWGLSGQIQRPRMFSHLKNMFTDIAFVQETLPRSNDQARLRVMGRSSLSFKF